MGAAVGDGEGAVGAAVGAAVGTVGAAVGAVVGIGATQSHESEQKMQELQWHTPVHGSSGSDEHWLTDVHVLRWRQLGFQLALSPEERDISLLSHMRYLENISFACEKTCCLEVLQKKTPPCLSPANGTLPTTKSTFVTSYTFTSVTKNFIHLCFKLLELWNCTRLAVQPAINVFYKIIARRCAKKNCSLQYLEGP